MRYDPPSNVPLKDILPPKPILLMGAGPVPNPPEVTAAASIVFSHLGVTMREIIKRVQLMGQYVCQTSSSRIIGIAGPSSAAMEMAMASLVWKGRKVLVLNMGTFSGRFGEMARGLGGDVTEIFPKDKLSCFSVDDVKAALEKGKFDVLTIAHGETSCGIKNIYLKEIVSLAKSYGLQVVVDAVVTLSCMPIPMDEWNIDVMLTGGQKGVSAIPGISMIAFSENVFEFILKRTDVMPHWCYDARRAWKFWGLGEYHYTAPVCGILALHEGLRLICNETLENRFERHEKSSFNLQKSLIEMGLELYALDQCRLNSVVAVKTPTGVTARELLANMITEYQVEISGAFGLDIVRIGQMGEQCKDENVERTLHALKASLIKLRG